MVRQISSPNAHLAICVPTYNRPEALDRCLSMLVEQCAPLGVAICVSDNASSFDAEGLVERHRASYPWIRFSRNSENLGMGANFLKVVELCEARYAWLFSDDDAMAHGAVAEMLGLCAEPSCAELIISNREYMKGDMTPDRGVVSEPILADETVKGGGALLRRAAVRHYTFIGCLCFQVDLWRRVRPERFLGLPYFPHLSIVASFMSDPTRRARLLAKPLVRVRGGGFSWERRAGAVWFKDLATCVRAAEGYSNEQRRAALRQAWRDINPYTLWLICKHGQRGAALASWRDSRSDHAAMGAWGLWAFNGIALSGALLTPGWVFGAARLAYRASRMGRGASSSR